MKTAILVDGDFYLRRHSIHFGKENHNNPKKIAQDLVTHCMHHIDRDKDRLYRIFFYDCPPSSKKIHHPLTERAIDLSKSSLYIFRTELHKELVKKPSLALRLGYLDENNADWKIRDPKINKKVLNCNTYS